MPSVAQEIYRFLEQERLLGLKLDAGVGVGLQHLVQRFQVLHLCPHVCVPVYHPGMPTL